VLILDMAVASLDASIQAKVLNLLAKICHHSARAVAKSSLIDA
jgi:ABC-type dipeptide/oligopeptide/nickel transport system ATPase subunit